MHCPSRSDGRARSSVETKLACTVHHDSPGCSTSVREERGDGSCRTAVTQRWARDGGAAVDPFASTCAPLRSAPPSSRSTVVSLGGSEAASRRQASDSQQCATGSSSQIPARRGGGGNNRSNAAAKASERHRAAASVVYPRIGVFVCNSFWISFVLNQKNLIPS
jgi:hypothetical protein